MGGGGGVSTARLDQLARALTALPARITAKVGEVVQENGHVLEDDNTAQLADGLDSKGRDIRPEYVPLTVEIKQQKGQETSFVNLRDTGDFYAGIVAQIRGKAVEMVGTDAKTDDLLGKYGGAILGLSDEAVKEFREEILQPELQDETRLALGL